MIKAKAGGIENNFTQKKKSNLFTWNAASDLAQLGNTLPK